MTNLLYLFMATILTQSATGKVVKPPNTIDKAQDSAQVNQITFDYSVEDRGWQSQAHPPQGQGQMRIDAQKHFRIVYSRPRVKSDTYDLNMTIQLAIDAYKKCEELGELELPGQIKDLPKNAAESLKNSIVDAMIFNDKLGFEARFICRVEILANF